MQHSPLALLFLMGCTDGGADDAPSTDVVQLLTSGYEACVIDGLGDLYCRDAETGEALDFSDTWLAPGNSFIQGATDQYEICLIEDPDGDGMGDIVCGRLFDIPAEPPERFEGDYVQVLAEGLICGLDVAGEITCFESWGSSLNDQFDSLPAGPFESIHGAGYSTYQHLCGLTADGDAACVGAGTFYNRAIKTCPLPTSGIVDVSFGGGITYLTDDGMITGWKDSTTDEEADCLTQSSPDAIDVERAYNAVCTRSTGGTAECTVIHADLEEYNLSADVPATPFTQISSFGAFGTFACGLSATDEITCWGDGWLGEPTFDFMN